MYIARPPTLGTKPPVSTLDSNLIKFAPTRETIAARNNNDDAEDKAHKKQGCIALHQERFFYLIKVLLHNWFKF